MINTISFENLGLSFNVNRVAFTIFGADIYWYGIIIATGLILAFIYASCETKKAGINQDDFLNMFLIALPCAIVCARIYYVIFNFSEYKDNITEIFDIRSGGIAIYGAIIGAVMVVIIYSKIKNIKLLKILDILAIGLLIGQSVGRWGNFVNGEAFGTSTNNIFAMTVVSKGITIADKVHPTFLYESLWNTLGIIILLTYKKRRIFEGELFSLYMIWYGFGRMCIEGLRADSLYIGSLRVSQILSAIILILGILFIIYGRKNAKNAK